MLSFDCSSIGTLKHIWLSLMPVLIFASALDPNLNSDLLDFSRPGCLDESSQAPFLQRRSQYLTLTIHSWNIWVGYDFTGLEEAIFASCQLVHKFVFDNVAACTIRTSLFKSCLIYHCALSKMSQRFALHKALNRWRFFQKRYFKLKGNLIGK